MFVSKNLIYEKTYWYKRKALIYEKGIKQSFQTIFECKKRAKKSFGRKKNRHQKHKFRHQKHKTAHHVELLYHTSYTTPYKLFTFPFHTTSVEIKKFMTFQTTVAWWTTQNIVFHEFFLTNLDSQCSIWNQDSPKDIFSKDGSIYKIKTFCWR